MAYRYTNTPKHLSNQRGKVQFFVEYPNLDRRPISPDFAEDILDRNWGYQILATETMLVVRLRNDWQSKVKVAA